MEILFKNTAAPRDGLDFALHDKRSKPDSGSARTAIARYALLKRVRLYHPATASFWIIKESLCECW